MSKSSDVFDELKSVLSGQGARFLDSILPLVLFLVVNAFFTLNIGLVASVGVALIFAFSRLLRKESLVYSLGGLGGVLLAGVFVTVLGSEAGFFVPGLITGALTVILCVVTVVINKPLVAWTSHLARRWPRAWYWHERVLPAYNEVTIIWGVAFAIKLALEYFLFQQSATDALGAVRIFMGWPFTILLLIGSYLHGINRLSKLEGPSVEEFRNGTPPPWEGQRKGF